MDFDYPAEAEAFRKEFRSWLEEHLPAGLRGGHRALDEERLEELRAWNRDLADAGYAAIAWPVEYGGRGAGVMEQVVFAEEMSRADAPGTLNPIGLANIAPSIMQWGTDEQKVRFLPRMLRGDDIWCQGFSEPDAGSDLASLSMRAVPAPGSSPEDCDEFVVTGQKVWTTLGHLADWCELLVRTDPTAPKHAGISAFLVDMRLPGIEVRPLTTITGEHEFNEIFFDAVRVPRSALLGPVNAGWKVAMTTLAHERGGVAALHLGTRKKIARLLEVARTTPRGAGMAADDPVVRRELARLYLEGEYFKLLADRALSGQLHGRPLGPESSLAKLVWSETENHISDVAALVLGPAALTGEWGHDRVYTRAMTIAGGTTQVNRNIVAQRVLGLPRA